MKKLGVILFALTLVFFVGCEKESINQIESDVFGTNIVESKRNYIQDEGIGEFINDIHEIKNLKEYKVYRNEDEMNIDFYFNENATYSDIMGSKDATMEVFVLKRFFKISGPYPQVLYNLKDWNKVNHRVYIGDMKILEQNIYKSKFLINKTEYHENTEIELPSRIVENDVMKKFSDKINKKYWWSIKDITFEKSFKGTVLLMKVKGRRKLSSKALSKIEDLISKEFAEDLAKISIEKYKMNMNYRGIVLIMYSNNKRYYEKTYFNGDNDKYWFSEYWGNHEYFDFNN